MSKLILLGVNNHELLSSRLFTIGWAQFNVLEFERAVITALANDPVPYSLNPCVINIPFDSNSRNVICLRPEASSTLGVWLLRTSRCWLHLRVIATDLLRSCVMNEGVVP